MSNAYANYYEKYLEVTKGLEEKAAPNGTVYHYTGWNGLSGILKSQQLWLSSFKNLNDTSEIYYGLYEIEKLIDSYKPKIGPGTLKDIFINVRNHISNGLDFLSISFCIKQDYLPSWQVYGGDGAGYAIGFKKDLFSKVTSEIRSVPISRGKIYYGLEELIPDIKKFISVIENDVRLQYRDSNNEAIREILTTIFPFIQSIKHPAFEGEHEHRIYSLIISQLMNKDHASIYHSPSQSSPHLNSQLKLLFNFSIEDISEIWVGPRLNFRHAKNDIEEILKNIKQDTSHIKIHQSFIPYYNPYYLEQINAKNY